MSVEVTGARKKCWTACLNSVGACRQLMGLAKAALLLLAGLQQIASHAASENVLGLPFTRFYSFEEIGSASRGARLDFDQLGRIAVMRGGSCTVLNDTTWIDIADNDPSGLTMHSLIFGPDGQAFYCAFGSWGIAEMSGGKLHPKSLVSAEAPKWALNSNFRDMVATQTDVYFTGINGVVHWDRRTDRQSFFEIRGVSRVFLVGQRLFVASYLQGICALNIAEQSVESIRSDGDKIDQAICYDESRALTSDMEGRLWFFDGKNFTPFPGILGTRALGRVSSLARLPDGNLAVGINGVGVHLVSSEGQILSSLTTPDYHRVTDLVARENGVLWLISENGVEKILYHSPLTVFGQRQGLPLSWPQLVRWDGRLVVASGGRLYDAIFQPGEAMRFHLMPNQPETSSWGIAATDHDLLIGTSSGLYTRKPDGTLTSVLSGFDAARLVHVNDVVYILGISEIAVVRQIDGRWVECAPRVPGLGYPLVVHGTNHAAWIELGSNRAARVHYRDGKLEVRMFESFPWKGPYWINIGQAGDIVALSGPPGGRIFFDEQTEAVVEHPPLEQVLEQAPYAVTRFQQDSDGTIWAAHDEGLLTIRMQGDRPVFDAATYGKINDRFPLVRVFPKQDVWLMTGQSLYHVNRDLEKAAPAYKPTLVSLTNGRNGRELLPSPGLMASLPTLHYEDNSLVFRFFAGTYTSRQSPDYEFLLHRGNDTWRAVGNGSLLTLTELREGSYRLEARIVDARETASAPLAIEFTIAPPWYRTWYAYACYVLATVMAIYGLMLWSVQRTRSRNIVLEKLVLERTNELHTAMHQLNEETRTSATLAERDRLAGEIHDSLQQGLSGLVLHLDATLKLSDLPENVRSRIGVARNMVSFTRHEVQHAVWDMETPLLEDTELGDALRKITALIGPGDARVQINVHGQPAPLSPATKHHLLRIGQEAITNAVRHAAATTITIDLNYESDRVSLSVADNGRGFAPNEILNTGFGHFGLRGLRGRAGKIGGDFRLESAPGQGTTVRVEVPIVTFYAHAR